MRNRWFVAVFLLLVPAGICAEDGGEKTEAAANAKFAAKFAVDEAKRHVIVAGESKPLALDEQSLLRWSNPVTAEVYGSVMLWKRDDCPAALASIYCFFDRTQVNAEFVSLSESSLIGKRNGKVRWAAEPGVKFEIIPGAPAVAESSEKRQLQTRSLARRFAASLAQRDDDTKFSELRLMSRPLLQYTASDDSGREGSLFAFVTTTDPELLLLVESRGMGEERKWHYAAARMHFCRLQLKLGEKVVWDAPQVAPPWGKLRGPDGTYIILEWPTSEAAAAM
jgi:hypothetical protein